MTLEENYRKLRLQALAVCSNDTLESMRGSIKNLKALIERLDKEPVKRKPDENGRLPLTPDELAEISELCEYEIEVIKEISIHENSEKLVVTYSNNSVDFLSEYLAIDYILKRFELGGN